MSLIQTAETQAAATPSSVLELLREGNRRFSRGEPIGRDHHDAARVTAAGQHPIAAVLGCIDSRVPIELVLDAGIGDLFAARTAGNVVDDDTLGGLEFATELAGAKAIVVLGHSACGAVKGACDRAELGNLTQLLAKITPAVEASGEGGENADSSDAEFVSRVIEQNVRNSITTLRTRSDILRRREESGDLVIAGAVYDLATGEIGWLADS